MNQSIAFLTDADNTLWDTDAIYRAAHSSLLEELAVKLGIDAPTDGVAYVRQFDESLALAHPLGLRYPVELLVRAVAVGLQGAEVSEASIIALREGSGKHVSEIVEALLANKFRAVLKSLPAVRDGVRQGLARLSALNVPFYVLSEGGKDRVSGTLARLDLPSPNGVIEIKKTSKDSFSMIRTQLAPLVPLVMVGDQLDRDIAPAREAGIRTVLFPGTFEPSWIGRIDRNLADLVVKSFDDAVTYFERQADSFRVASRKGTRALS
jgi:putative hydrolase of the HAD superfamily